MPTTFLRLLAADDKATAMRAAVAAINTGSPAADVYTVDPASFHQIPGSPFAYWVSETIRDVFGQLTTFETSSRTVKVGLQTSDDFQFVRTWWEESPSAIDTASWAPFAKGGAFSRYYDDPYLLVDWRDNGAIIRNFASSFIRNEEAYFRPGLTYPSRTNGFSVRAMPAGCIFSHKGPAMFVDGDSEERLLALLVLVNSAPFYKLLSLMIGRVELAQSFEVGLIQRTPVPDLAAEYAQTLAELAREAHDLKREADRDDEVTHPFTAPALVRLRQVGSLAQSLDALAEEGSARERRLAEIQREIDERCFALYGFSAEDRAQVTGNSAGVGVNANDEADADNGDEASGTAETDETDEDESARPEGAALARRNAADLLMYAVGCAFGRWDVRIGRDSSLAPQLADPFAPLPVCAPGALVGPDGLPAKAETIVSEAWLRARPDAITLPEAGTVAAPTIPAGEYPIPVAGDGILVDDPDAQDDIVRRVRATLDELWGERADAIEREACALLGVQDLRDYLRNPRGFFDHHIGRYSKSRRKAPIYWLLQSPKRHYGIWLYYHRLDADLVFKALNFHLLPRIRRDEQRLTELEAARQAAGTTGSEARRAAQAVDRQEALLADLREFYAALDRAAKRYLKPDLNDGVLLNIAPFCEVVPWKEAKSAWQQLLAGKYEWSSIGKQLREKGLMRGK